MTGVDNGTPNIGPKQTSILLSGHDLWHRQDTTKYEKLLRLIINVLTIGKLEFCFLAEEILHRCHGICMDHPVNAPSQWETTLRCNVVCPLAGRMHRILPASNHLRFCDSFMIRSKPMKIQTKPCKHIYSRYMTHKVWRFVNQKEGTLLFKSNGIFFCGGKIWCLFLRYRLEILCVA